MAHVNTVICPICQRMWTGEFNDPVPEQDICKDCIAKDEGMRKQAQDIHNNPGGKR